MKIKELLPVKIYSYTLNNYKNFDQTLLTVELAIFIIHIRLFLHVIMNNFCFTSRNVTITAAKNEHSMLYCAGMTYAVRTKT